MRSGNAPIRLWPGVVAALLLVLVRFVLPAFVAGSGGGAMVGGLAAGLAVLVWWLFFSRAPWAERVGAVVLMAVAIAATSLVVHPSIANGMMGLMLPLFAIPLVALALVVSVAAGRGVSNGRRRAWMGVAILVACLAMTLVRTGGVTGDGESDLHWRWTPTAEERLLALGANEVDPGAGGDRAPVSARPADVESEPTAGGAPPPTDPVSTPAAATVPTPGPPAAAGGLPEAVTVDPRRPLAGPEWPGFRGPGRDSVVDGVRIGTDWSTSPPVELWRRPVGPGWSSFAVQGDFVYTQEQRGEDELVACYRLTTGEPVWMHRDGVRFWESNGGAGPRATPTLADGRVYTLGATGILNALDARDGSVVWTRNAVSDTGKEIPDWGIAGSPLVTGDLVVVAVAGQLVAYDAASGEQRWLGPAGGGGYSSPHLLTIDGVSQVLLMRGARTTSVAPADGAVLWEDSWQPAVSIVQPALTGDGDVLVTAGDAMGGIGIRRIRVGKGAGGWTVEERWTSRGLKPYYNDFVVHEGHAFGFDGSILACINLTDGTRAWKGGRYGHGQLLLLSDQDVLLVLSEEGGLALVGATSDEYRELATFQALEGKTWNHPVLVGDVLLVRNDREMAAFRLPLTDR